MLKARQKLGKYRIVRHVARGGFADVYEASDTVEGIRVALKVPHPHLLTDEALEDFRREARLVARLDHPNILPLKTADFVDGLFVIVVPLGSGTLAERMRKRLSLRTALDYAEQTLQALAHAHDLRIIHCDVKPENLLLFPHGRLRLTDFGISKVSLRTVSASGSGTLGYVAPEQAMGRPSKRSDVFSMGLILYRLFAGVLPEWPFEWPPPRHERLRQRVPALMVAFIRKAMHVDQRHRFEDAGQMLKTFLRIKPRVLARGSRKRRRRGARARPPRDWQRLRQREFLRTAGRGLGMRHTCTRCAGPVAEAMTTCPWCGTSRRRHRDDVAFPALCPRCRRGIKLDWRFCPWCYGAAIGPLAERAYADKRYEARCAHAGCSRRQLMPFMRYCPWCHRKVKRRWRLARVAGACDGCGWGVARDAWDWCPWCGRTLKRTGTSRGR